LVRAAGPAVEASTDVVICEGVELLLLLWFRYTTKERRMARTATVGPEIFERTNTLVAEGKSRTEAFAQIGQERGSSPGTVAANYYRVARSQGQGSAQRRTTRSRPRKVSTATATPARQTRRRAPASGNGDIRQIARQIADLTDQLVRQIEERNQKVRALLGE
jgi:hypothetical protein